MRLGEVATVPFSDLFLAAAVFFYSLNFGPMMFESFTSDRTWASHPPESFSMFLGPYGHKTAGYWKIVSPLAMVSFVLSLVFNWPAGERRLWLSIASVGYLAVQAATMAYFVPEQDGLITRASTIDRGLLKSRVERWILLNYVRNAAAVLAFGCLLRAVLSPRLP